MSEVKARLIAELTAIKNGGPADPEEGICGNIEQRIFRQEQLAFAVDVMVLLERAFDSLMNNPAYPIHDPKCGLTRGEQFNRLRHWEGRQGELRLQLIDDVLAWLVVDDG